MKFPLALVLAPALLLCVGLCLFTARSASAVKIRFPDEELASETVLPLFQPVHAVLNRNINLRRRFEAVAGVTFGWDEPFRSIYYPSGSLSFYWADAHGLSLTGMYLPPFYSSAGKKLTGKALLSYFENPPKDKSGRPVPVRPGQAGVCSDDPEPARAEDCQEWKLLDAHKAPYPHIMGFLNYVYTPYYGKISITKNFVMNLSIYGFTGPGLIVFNENSKTPAFNLGIGKRFYFSKHFALRGDIGFYVYRGPDLTRNRRTLAKTRGEIQAFVNDKTQISYQAAPKSFWIHLTAAIGAVVLL